MSAQLFLEELKEQPQDLTTLDWAIRQLEALSTKTARLNWDTRAGLLGVTLGIEFTIYSLLACGWFLICFYIFPIPFVWKFPVGILLSLVIPVGLGFWLRGGPVFRFMEIDVCTKNGQLADRFRCAFRSFLSWLPVLMPVGGVIISSIIAAENIANIEPVEGNMTYDWRAHPVFDNTIVVAILTSIVVVMGGLVYSLYSPERGLQDHGAGTRLMPN